MGLVTEGWPQKGNEALLVASQDQAPNTNSMPKNIYHHIISDICRLYKEEEETDT